jgi:hypothetical protein
MMQVREPAATLHVVLHHDDRVTARHRHQQCGGTLALLGRHPGDRFVYQQQFRMLHEQQADFEPLLLPV